VGRRADRHAHSGPGAGAPGLGNQGAVTSDLLSANLRALADAQPSLPPLSMGERVRLQDGVWRGRHNGRDLAFHGRDPHRDADRRVAELLGSGPPPSLIVAIGLGLGFLLDALERRAWTGTVLAFEPEPDTVRHLLGRRDWRQWICENRLRVFISPDYTGSRACWSLFGDGSMEPVTCVNPALEQLRPGQVQRARHALERIRFDARANADARRTHASTYLLHTLRNLPAIASETDVSALYDAAPGIPAVLVAAGPSLDRALPALAALGESALIVAVDTALRPLLSAGVAPHLVVAVDPTEGNGRHLTDLPPCPGTYLVAEGSVDPLAVRGFAGRAFFFTVADHAPWPWLRGVGWSAGALRAWGSVLTTAFDLTLRMGCNPVAFVGADLAFTGHRPYARGVTYEHDWRRRAHFGEPLEGQWAHAVDVWPATIETDVHGSPTRTAPHLVAFRDWLVEEMKRAEGRSFINATDAGILGDPACLTEPERLSVLLPQSGTDLRVLVRHRHRPREASRLLAAAKAIVRDNAAGVLVPVLAQWEVFAPGIEREQILGALESALHGQRSIAPAHDSAANSAPADVRATAWCDPDQLGALAASTTLVPMRMPAHRLHRGESGARVFRFRTAAARIICSVIQPVAHGVCEDGRPLRRAAHLDDVGPGSYSMLRDEVHFRASDGSDARVNGRDYTVMVPPCVRLLEAMPLEEVLRQDV